MPNQQLTRRTFLKVTTIAGTGMMVGCSFQSNPNISTPNAKSEDLGLWIRISNDDSITIISPTSELGQGTHTAHAMIIAEELEVDWNKIKVVTAPARSEYKKNLYLQSTSANDGITTWWDRLAEIGAGTREILVEAGAQKMGVPKTECEVQDGHVFHRKSSRKMSYGQLAKAASKLDPPSTPKLKSRDKYSFVGKPIQRIDQADVEAIVRPIWVTKHETADRTLGRIRSIIEYYIATNQLDKRNPAQYVGYLEHVLPEVDKRAKHFPALPYLELPEFFQELSAKHETSHDALKLIVLTAQRQGDVRSARWEQLDLDKAIWDCVVNKRKKDEDTIHRVPLPKEACLLYTSPSPRDRGCSRMPSSA